MVNLCKYVGGSVSLSADGKVVAIGATHHNNKTGKVRVYQLGDGNGSRLLILMDKRLVITLVLKYH